MLIPVFGDPSQSTITAVRAIQTLTEVSRGAFHWVCAGTVEDLVAAWNRPLDKDTVFFADITDNRISRLFLESAAPLVIFLGPPNRIANALMLERKYDPLTATRVTSQCLSCLHDIAIEPRALVVSDLLNFELLKHLLPELANIFKISIDASVLRETLGRISALEAEKIEETSADAAAANELTNAVHSASVITALGECLKGFEPLLRKEPVEQVHWPREVFLDSADQGNPLCRTLDLTGPARLLFYGPFLHLPRGSWFATATFEVRNNLSGNFLKIDLYYEGVIGEWECEMPRDGIYKFDLQFEVFEPRFPIQIRFYIKEGAIEGLFDLKHVELRRV